MGPDRRRARRTVALQSALQERFSYTMAFRDLSVGGSVILRRMRAFAMASDGWDAIER